MKFKTKRKINNFQLKLNIWILEILCYPVNKIEKTIKSKIQKIKNKNRPDIYNYISIK